VALNSSCSLPGVLMRREPREARSPLKVATSRSAIHRYAMTRRFLPISAAANSTRAKPASLEMLLSIDGIKKAVWRGLLMDRRSGHEFLLSIRLSEV
jgi:hypothetical protein